MGNFFGNLNALEWKYRTIVTETIASGLLKDLPQIQPHQKLLMPLNELPWELVRQHLETMVTSIDMLQLFMREKGHLNVNIAKRAFQKNP